MARSRLRICCTMFLLLGATVVAAGPVTKYPVPPPGVVVVVGAGAGNPKLMVITVILNSTTKMRNQPHQKTKNRILTMVTVTVTVRPLSEAQEFKSDSRLGL